MKISFEHMNELRKAIDKVLAEHPLMHAHYISEGKSEKDFRWDMLHKSKFDTKPLYDSGMHDEHIDTALRACIPPLKTKRVESTAVANKYPKFIPSEHIDNFDKDEASNKYLTDYNSNKSKAYNKSFADKPLDPHEHDALNIYSSPAFAGINRVLKNKEPSSRSIYSDVIERLDSAFTKSHAPENMLLFRNTAHDIKKYEVGKQYKVNHYLSTSSSPGRTIAFDRGNKTFMQLHMPKGHPAINMNEHSENPDEDEVLLPRGSSFKVTHIEKGKHRNVVHAEVQPYAAKLRKPVAPAKKAKPSENYKIPKKRTTAGTLFNLKKYPSGKGSDFKRKLGMLGFNPNSDVPYMNAALGKAQGYMSKSADVPMQTMRKHLAQFGMNEQVHKQHPLLVKGEKVHTFSNGRKAERIMHVFSRAVGKNQHAFGLVAYPPKKVEKPVKKETTVKVTAGKDFPDFLPSEHIDNYDDEKTAKQGPTPSYDYIQKFNEEHDKSPVFKKSFVDKDDFDEKEKYALYRYAGEDYEGINHALRRDENPEGVVEPSNYSKAIGHLDDALNKSHTPENMLLFRSTTNKLHKYEEGKQYKVNHYLSTSHTPDGALNFDGPVKGRKTIMQFHVPKGHPAINMNDFSDEKQEKEILLPRGTSFKVTHVEKRKNVDIVHGEVQPYKEHLKHPLVPKNSHENEVSTKDAPKSTPQLTDIPKAISDNDMMHAFNAKTKQYYYGKKSGYAAWKEKQKKLIENMEKKAAAPVHKIAKAPVHPKIAKSKVSKLPHLKAPAKHKILHPTTHLHLIKPLVKHGVHAMADGHSAPTYTARIHAKDGRTLYKTEPHASREEAVKTCFAAKPKADKCSSERGYGFDIREHRRSDQKKETTAMAKKGSMGLSSAFEDMGFTSKGGMSTNFSGVKGTLHTYEHTNGAGSTNRLAGILANTKDNLKFSHTTMNAKTGIKKYHYNHSDGSGVQFHMSPTDSKKLDKIYHFVSSNHKVRAMTIEAKLATIAGSSYKVLSAPDFKPNNFKYAGTEFVGRKGTLHLFKKSGKGSFFDILKKDKDPGSQHLHNLADALSNKLKYHSSTLNKKTGERNHYFRKDDNPAGESVVMHSTKDKNGNEGRIDKITHYVPHKSLATIAGTSLETKLMHNNFKNVLSHENINVYTARKRRDGLAGMPLKDLHSHLTGAGYNKIQSSTDGKTTTTDYAHPTTKDHVRATSNMYGVDTVMHHKGGATTASVEDKLAAIAGVEVTAAKKSATRTALEHFGFMHINSLPYGRDHMDRYHSTNPKKTRLATFKRVMGQMSPNVTYTHTSGPGPQNTFKNNDKSDKIPDRTVHHYKHTDGSVLSLYMNKIHPNRIESITHFKRGEPKPLPAPKVRKTPVKPNDTGFKAGKPVVRKTKVKETIKTPKAVVKKPLKKVAVKTGISSGKKGPYHRANNRSKMHAK